MSDQPGEPDPAYRQLAAILREQITSGAIPPGGMLPFEKRLAQEYGVGRQTVRQALDVLRTEGLVVSERGYGTRVVEQQHRQIIRVPRSARIRLRMPTDAERVELGIEPGAIVPVAVIHVGAQTRGPFRGDTCDFTTA
ncbi:GntR family transcriptional regulator [Micromonospora cathayae]|uniref:GntR family transcriptional regulator n=1 Tax=Micromonospora cathayae TaxID=3028804 RepID=A0ABY7ZYR8_9ACTN|nr:GntR family transcriptional regulator [Micromonospora sp. HUAS 3]WDZ87158.1 GntR family transcriptional regulator [Micromonospora sp. HUAS 3]